MEKNIFIVTEYYTPYKHNGCTERERKTAFSCFKDAVQYVKGTDGNGHLLRHEDMVDIWLKPDCKPLYDIATFAGEGIAFKVREECINEDAIEQGGYVTKVVIEKLKVN